MWNGRILIDQLHLDLHGFALLDSCCPLVLHSGPKRIRSAIYLPALRKQLDALVALTMADDASAETNLRPGRHNRTAIFQPSVARSDAS